MPNPSVLLVDDDASLLRSYARLLGDQFDLSIADSGVNGLEALDAAEFDVVVTDMQMPSMNGLQFVENAAAKVTQTSFLMLTGSIERDIAVSALNQGIIKRFIEKPCDVKELRAEIQSVVDADLARPIEQRLLSRTLVAAVGLMGDILEANVPGIGLHQSRLEDTADKLRESVGMAPSWELTIASRLTLAGLSCLGDGQRRKFFGADPTRPEWNELLTRATSLAAGLVEKIPRLEGVARIIRLIPRTTGRTDSQTNLDSDPIVIFTATLLHAAVVWDFLIWQGLNHREAQTEIRAALPDLEPKLFEGLRDLVELPDKPPTVMVTPEDLVPGMVVGDDVLGPSGELLIRVGARLTDVTIAKLRNAAEVMKDLTEVMVVDHESLATHAMTMASAKPIGS